MTGRVVLVGAGPGDSDLRTTVKGARALSEADVVVYDHGSRRRRCSSSPPRRAGDAWASGGHAMKQEQIDAVLVEQALLGRTVGALEGRRPVRVRVRGGEVPRAPEAASVRGGFAGITSTIAAPAKRPASRSRTADRRLVRGGRASTAGTSHHQANATDISTSPPRSTRWCS